MVSSPQMNAHDALGFGTQISLDGASADPKALADTNLTAGVLTTLIRGIELDQPPVTVDDVVLLPFGEDGHSAALVKGESWVSLHAFTELRSVTMQCFSVRDLPLGRTVKAFLDSYRVGRFQSSVRGRGLLLPRDSLNLERTLRGERAYARLRVVPGERVTL